MSTLSKCALCNLEFSNGEQLQQHLEGKRHKKVESIREERENSAKRSLFVSNLKKDTFIKQLEEHFLQFGKISKIVTDQEKNAYAIVEFESESGVENSLAFSKDHLVNGRHLKVARRQLKEFVSKIGSNNEKKKETLEKLKEEALVVNKLLAKCDSFDEQIDTLVNHLKITDEQHKIRENICESLSQIFKQFWSEDEFQISIFGSSFIGLAANGSDMDMTLLFKQYLVENQTKQQKLPKIVVRNLSKQAAAGNSSSNNSKDNSDSNSTEAIETEVYLDENIEMNGEDTNDANHNNSDLTLKESITKFFNDKSYTEFLKFDVEHQVKIAARIIQRFFYDIKSLRTITNTRCPVVSFFHDKANINCDLSLNNFLAFENSKLVKVYTDLMPNLKKLIFVLRYWFKQKNLHSSSKFNSYTIIWMAIFYMQQMNVAYLPTVQHLNKLTSSVMEVHGWDCAFETDLAKIKASQPESFQKNKQINENNMNDLLKGFFEFYSSFKFSTSDSTTHKIISTRSGQILSSHKNETQKPTDLSHLSKITDFINIQDPFDLSHNLTANICSATVEKFILECKASSELLTYSNTPRKSLTKSWGLILLMTKKALPIVPTLTSHSTKISTSNTDSLELKLTDGDNKQKEVDFVLFLLKDCLKLEQLTGDKLISLKRKKPLKVLNQICEQVDSLGLNSSPKRLRVDAKDTNNKTMYVCMGNAEVQDDEESSINNNNEKLIDTYQFCAKYNTWQGRRPMKRELKGKVVGAEIDLEKMTSEKLIEKSQVTPQKPTNFRVQFLSCENLPNKLKIKFDLLDDIAAESNQLDLAANFTTLVHFLDVYINNGQEKLFSQWNQN